MVPAIEYLCETAPHGPHGLSAFDLTSGFALASPVERRLVPFMVPQGTAQTDIAARLFQNFTELSGLFTRWRMDEALRRQTIMNRTRIARTSNEGDIVFRRLPAHARAAKHLLPEPSTGPYEVHYQLNPTSVVLRHPETKELVGGGVAVPMDQI